jgi:hypothetical protein
MAVGAYWLSTWAIVPLEVFFGKFEHGMVYGNSILAAIAMGVMFSLARSVSAGAAGICVTLVADSKKSELWAIIPAVLYATRHFRSSLPPSTWYRVMLNTERFLPAIVCIIAAFLVGRLRSGRRRQPPGARA